MSSPNRSLTHWMVVLACCGIACASMGICTNSVGVFYGPVAESFGVGRASVSLYGTLINLIGGLGCPIAARLMARCKLKPLFLLACIVIAGGMMLLSVAPNILFFYLVALFIGFAVCFTGTMGILTVLGNWFEQRYGLASGIALAFTGVGAALLSPVFTALIEAFGWRAAFLCAGAVSALVTIPGVLWVITFHPEERHCLPYGASGSRVVEAADAPVDKLSPRALFTPAFLLLFVMGLFAGAITSLNLHLPGYAAEIHLSAASGALLVSCAMVGNILFKVLIGMLCDRFGARPACLIMLGINAVAVSTLLIITDVFALMLVAAFAFGAIYSVSGLGFSQLVRLLVGSEHFAQAYGYGIIAPCVGCALSNVLFGAMFDALGSYRPVLILCVALAVTCIALVLFLFRKKPA